MKRSPDFRRQSLRHEINCVMPAVAFGRLERVVNLDERGGERMLSALPSKIPEKDHWPPGMSQFCTT